MTARVENVLYITTEGGYLGKDHDTVVFRIDDEKKIQVPLLHLSSVVVMARTYVTPELMHALMEAGVSLSFLTDRGRFLGRLEGLATGNVLLRRAHFRVADDGPRKLEIAKGFVIGKLSNARRFLRRQAREAAEPATIDRLDEAARATAEAARTALGASTLNELRGHEGEAAKAYFAVLNVIVKRDEPELRVRGRSRRPPKDPVNAMLSFAYSLLLNDAASALMATGLDPYVGFLHVERPGRMSLALDLMEELRIAMADRVVFALLNRGQIGPEHFTQDEAGGFRLTDDGRKTFLISYQKAKQADVRHDFLDQTVPWARVPLLQARLLARAIRGDVETYPPFAMPS